MRSATRGTTRRTTQRAGRPARGARPAWIAVGLLLALGLGATLGCEVGIPSGQEPYYEFNWTDMGDQPKVKPQRGDLLGVNPKGGYAPPMGAVATDEHPYRFTQKEAALAALAGANPLPASPETLAKGEWVWTNFCITCHGPEAAGDGHVTKKFPPPPSLLRQKVRDYTDARIFHVPMRGQGSMPSYAKQLEPDELWAVVHFVRALQAKLPVAPPTKQDLEAQGAAAPAPPASPAGK